MSDHDERAAVEAVRRNVTARLLACNAMELAAVDLLLELIEKERDAYLAGPLPFDRHVPNALDSLVAVLVDREIKRADLRDDAGREIAAYVESAPARAATMRPLIEAAYEHERTKIGAATSIARSHADAVTDRALGRAGKDRR